jgi:hypothetical protein
LPEPTIVGKPPRVRTFSRAGLPLLALVKASKGSASPDAKPSRCYAEEQIGYGPFADFPILFGIRDFSRPILDGESQMIHVIPSSPTVRWVAFVPFPFTSHEFNGQG